MRVPFRPALLLLPLLCLGAVACTGSSNAEEQDSPEARSGATSKSASSVETPASAGASHPVRIAQGQRIDLDEHVVEGQITVFDFMSDFCPPCKRIAPWMDRLHNEREGVAVVKVDINRPDVRGIDWRSPVAVQFGLRSIPHFKIYDAEGELMAEGDAANAILDGWFRELASQG